MMVKIEYTFIGRFGHLLTEFKVMDSSVIEERLKLIFPEYSMGPRGMEFEEVLKKAGCGEDCRFDDPNGAYFEFICIEK